MRKIRRAMEKTQDEMRYEHTLGVAYTAAALAMRYGASVENAQLAGLLHDCAKCLDDDKKLQSVKTQYQHYRGRKEKSVPSACKSRQFSCYEQIQGA